MTIFLLAESIDWHEFWKIWLRGGSKSCQPVSISLVTAMQWKEMKIFVLLRSLSAGGEELREASMRAGEATNNLSR
ncbi:MULTISPECIES: hypothetical protein [Rhizobium]|uniref:hypothetical protein n=1 Tax=Rhizobium TaxID=379 RepID=UPI0012F4B20A|nr:MULTISPECIES: hypothetical protein [Rhizobium]